MVANISLRVLHCANSCCSCVSKAEITDSRVAFAISLLSVVRFLRSAAVLVVLLAMASR